MRDRIVDMGFEESEAEANVEDNWSLDEGLRGDKRRPKATRVEPISGWWRERAALGRVESNARYALFITIDTPDAEIDLYTPIETLISTLIPVGVET